MEKRVPSVNCTSGRIRWVSSLILLMSLNFNLQTLISTNSKEFFLRFTSSSFSSAQCAAKFLLRPHCQVYGPSRVWICIDKLQTINDAKWVKNSQRMIVKTDIFKLSILTIDVCPPSKTTICRTQTLLQTSLWT